MSRRELLEMVEGYYTGKFRQFGTTHQGVDWSSEESQRLRFEQICRVMDGAGPHSLIDYGCGYGALFAFLQEREIAVQYSGCDLSPEIVDSARQLHGDRHNCRFFVGDDQLSAADYVVASGIFNVKGDVDADEWQTYVLATLAKLDRLSRRGFSFNVLTSYSDPPLMKDYLYYADPCFLFDYCKRRFARNVALLHDYQLCEFTLIVRKD